MRYRLKQQQRKLLSKSAQAVAMAGLLGSLATPVLAQNSENHWYFVPQFGVVIGDSERDTDNGVSAALSVGRTLSRIFSVEARAYTYSMSSDNPDRDTDQSGLGVDALWYPFGRTDYVQSFAPFVLAGVGYADTDIGDNFNSSNATLNLGFGSALRLGQSAVSLRGEGRYIFDFVDADDADTFNDWQASLGVEIALNRDDNEIDAAQSQPRNSAQDSDGDGIADFEDYCPASRSAANVDGRGCAVKTQRLASNKTTSAQSVMRPTAQPAPKKTQASVWPPRADNRTALAPEAQSKNRTLPKPASRPSSRPEPQAAPQAASRSAPQPVQKPALRPEQPLPIAETQPISNDPLIASPFAVQPLNYERTASTQLSVAKPEINRTTISESTKVSPRKGAGFSEPKPLPVNQRPVAAATTTQSFNEVVVKPEPRQRPPSPAKPRKREIDLAELTAVRDSDGDGIRDAVDRCKNTKPGGFIDADGCAIDLNANRQKAAPAQSKQSLKTTANTTKTKAPVTQAAVQQAAPPKPTAAPPQSRIASLLAKAPSANAQPTTEMAVAASTSAAQRVNASPDSLDRSNLKTITTMVLSGVKFKPGSAILVEESQVAISRVAKLMKKQPSVVVEVGGHTDWNGSASSNLTLSEKRAAAVQEELVNAGISGNRLEAKGYGDAKPVADNNTAAGRAKNRRIELTLLRPK